MDTSVSPSSNIPSRGHPNFPLYLRVFCAGLCGLIVTCLLLRQWKVLPRHLVLNLEHLEAHPEYDTLFFGPSYVKTQIDAGRLDRALRARGIIRKSLSISYSNWGVTELDQVIEAVIRLPLPNLKTIFVDVTLAVGREFEANLFDRSIRQTPSRDS